MTVNGFVCTGYGKKERCVCKKKRDCDDNDAAADDDDERIDGDYVHFDSTDDDIDNYSMTNE